MTLCQIGAARQELFNRHACADRLPPLQYVEAGCRYLYRNAHIMVEIQKCSKTGCLQFVLISSLATDLKCNGIKPFYVNVSALVNEETPPCLSPDAKIFWLYLLDFKRYSQQRSFKGRT